MIAPGPSHLLMLSVSMSNGFHRSLATAAGDLSANTLQILLAGLGLASVIAQIQHGFAFVKWAGVAYLVWVGVRQIIASYKTRTDSRIGSADSLQRLWFRGFVTSAVNPKAVVFFAALFPQFLDPQLPLFSQIAILGATYIIIDGCFLASYGKAAAWLARQLHSRYKKWVERAAGTGLIAAAILLGLRGGDPE